MGPHTLSAADMGNSWLSTIYIQSPAHEKKKSLNWDHCALHSDINDQYLHSSTVNLVISTTHCVKDWPKEKQAQSSALLLSLTSALESLFDASQ